MRIALFDPYLAKFTLDMRLYWESQGYEVRTDPKGEYDPKLAEWADLVWFDTCSNNLISATNPDAALLADDANYSPWRLQDMGEKKVIVRPIDIDIWTGHHASVDWSVVDDVIFIAPHIQQLMMSDSRPQQGNFKQHVIPCGVNLDRWTFKERQHGFNIGIVSELWESKGVDLVLQIALKLKEIDHRYNIEWVGPQQMYHWGKAYFDDFIKRNELPIRYSSERVENLDEWWEDKNYVLHCSAKEAYSYAVAEAMAKGIRPVFHHYYGAEATWPGLTWDGIDEAIEIITQQDYHSQNYRQYLVDHNLDLESMMSSINEVINN